MGQRGRPRHPDVLTPREQDVLALIRDGLTNEQIAVRLNISFETAKSQSPGSQSPARSAHPSRTTRATSRTTP